jgi:Family of unknown function (DUF6011)
MMTKPHAPGSSTDSLNDDLSDLLGGAVIGPPIKRAPEGFTPATERIFSELCVKCRGSGRFVGWSGRAAGACFACKGTGKLTFKTAPEERAKDRAKYATSKQAARDEFRQTYKAELAWLAAAYDRQQKNAHHGRKVWNFPIEVTEKLAKYGSLFDSTIEAIRKCMARDVERAGATASRDAARPMVDTSMIEAAFAKARDAASNDGEGLKWLSLRLDTFKFSDAPATERFSAAVFVTEGGGEEKRKLGRISGGKFYRSPACDDPTESRILAAIADPKAAAIAYGQRTGSCSVCGRELTNAESRARSMGPICADKFGW